MAAHIRSLVLCCIALAVWTACASDVQVATSFDPIERFPVKASWRWDELRNVLPTDERLVAMDLGHAVQDAVAAELAAVGYREAGPNLPDYLLTYQLNVSPQIRPERSFSIGSLSLLLRDAKSKRHVWMAFVQTEVDVNRSEAERRERLREVVRQMLLNFPPRSDR